MYEHEYCYSYELLLQYRVFSIHEYSSSDVVETWCWNTGDIIWYQVSCIITAD